MKAKINKSLVNSLQPETNDVFVWDTELPRFGLKLTPKGKVVYLIQYRAKGRLRRLTIGTGLAPDRARQLAGQQLQEVAAGEDPADAVMEERHGVTVEELSERYMKEHAAEKKKARSAHEDLKLIRQVVKPAFGKRTVSSVTRTNIAALHHKLHETPYQANRVLALLRKMMNLAEGWGLRPLNSNPCAHIEKFREQKRRRFLDAGELARLGAVLKEAEETNSEPFHAIAAIRMLLFTGARLNEILTAKYQYVNRELGALVLPDSKTGFKSIPLSEPAMGVIDNLPIIEGTDYLFPGHKRGGHFVGLNHVWGRLRTKAGLNDVRIHDLRHSFASVGAASGLGLPIIGALLGHLDQSTTQRYSHLQADPLKQAAEVIGRKIDEAMKRKP